ncbi:DNA-invertase hin [Arthrobacter sp. SO3]|nr:DNA-invertase hin [Arthrobacter sp. SO3]
MLELATILRARGIGLRVLNLGGGDVDTGTPMGGMVFTVMAALAQMELEIQRERITDSVSKRRAAGRDLGGRRERFTDSQIENARRLIDAGQAGAVTRTSIIEFDAADGLLRSVRGWARRRGRCPVSAAD